jgi:hypothetical protein
VSSIRKVFNCWNWDHDKYPSAIDLGTAIQEYNAYRKIAVKVGEIIKRHYREAAKTNRLGCECEFCVNMRDLLVELSEYESFDSQDSRL